MWSPGVKLKPCLYPPRSGVFYFAAVMCKAGDVQKRG